jgi:hypothetical protein
MSKIPKQTKPPKRRFCFKVDKEDYPLTESLRPLPALNLGTLTAGI